jgi:hypothetical protein
MSRKQAPSWVWGALLLLALLLLALQTAAEGESTRMHAKHPFSQPQPRSFLSTPPAEARPQ